MNVDDGRIRLWRDLSADEKESGRWVKLGDDEFARAATIDEKERSDALMEIFGRETEKSFASLMEELKRKLSDQSGVSLKREEDKK